MNLLDAVTDMRNCLGSEGNGEQIVQTPLVPAVTQMLTVVGDVIAAEKLLNFSDKSQIEGRLTTKV